jgi:hypothetical protein
LQLKNSGGTAFLAQELSYELNKEYGDMFSILLAEVEDSPKENADSYLRDIRMYNFDEHRDGMGRNLESDRTDMFETEFEQSFETGGHKFYNPITDILPEWTNVGKRADKIVKKFYSRVKNSKRKNMKKTQNI